MYIHYTTHVHVENMHCTEKERESGERMPGLHEEESLAGIVVCTENGAGATRSHTERESKQCVCAHTMEINKREGERGAGLRNGVLARALAQFAIVAAPALSLPVRWMDA